MIQFKDFSCYYKNKKEYTKVLDGLNFTINTGDFVVILGESGCGKTTLLRSCLGLAEFYEGDLFIDDVSVDGLKIKYDNYAYVSQEIGLYSNMTVYENIAFPLRCMKTAQDEIDRRVKEVAEQLEISFLLTRKPRQLSGGQQQRVAIARAIIKKPRYIYFDEPFSNIDKKLHCSLRELVKKIYNELKPTILFVTHDMADALNLSDRIVVIEDGKIADDCTPQELLERHKSRLISSYLENRIDLRQLVDDNSIQEEKN